MRQGLVTRPLILHPGEYSVGDNEAARVELEDRFNDKERELRTQQAKAEKAQALFNIAINTDVGISKALAQTGPLAPAIYSSPPSHWYSPGSSSISVHSCLQRGRNVSWRYYTGRRGRP